jgi:hypothetical protein
LYAKIGFNKQTLIVREDVGERFREDGDITISSIDIGGTEFIFEPTTARYLYGSADVRWIYVGKAFFLK